MASKFEAASYAYGSGFVRAIGKYRVNNGVESFDFIIINPTPVYEKQDVAAMHARMDITAARAKTVELQESFTLDHYLSAIGYQRLDLSETEEPA